MSAWASKAKSGGGGSVEGKVTGYVFTNYFPLGDDLEAGDNIYMDVEITPDGADEPVHKPLYLGSGSYLVICDEDGEPVEADKEGLISGAILKGGEDNEVDEESTPRLYSEGNVYKFIESLEEAGFPAESEFPDPNETKTIDFRALIGWRIRISEEIDEEAMNKINPKTGKAFGKRKATSGKNKGKEYNRTFTKVVKVFEKSEDEDKPKSKKATNGSGKKVEGKASTKSKKVEDENEEEAEEESSVSAKTADKFLVEVVKSQPKETVNKEGLALAITRFTASKQGKAYQSDRDALRKFITEDKFAFIADAAERGVVEVDKKGVISVA